MLGGIWEIIFGSVSQRGWSGRLPSGASRSSSSGTGECGPILARCFVEPAEGGGKARWLTPGVSGASFELARAARDVLLGAEPPVALTQRAKRVLAEVRDEHVPAVRPGGTVITRDGDDVRWWTWAGYRAM